MVKLKQDFSLLVICLACLAISYSLSLFPTRYFQTPHFWIPTLFFAITTLGVNLILFKGHKNSKEFVFKSLALSMARLLACMVFVLIYSLVNKPQALAFTCHFMIQYIIFTAYETFVLLKFIKTN